jgi:transcriptional regulator with GAF, ATPase, and Fis domain
VDRYRILGPLGVGGAGRVVLVEDRLRPGSRLALKELLDAGPVKTEELHREFATLATLRHPSLVEVHELEVAAETGRSQLVMEYIDGDDIVATIRAEGPGSLPPLAAEILRALAFLHDFGLVHRDLKPGNILVRRLPKAGHRVVVLDFGLAAQRSEAATPRSAEMAGTLPYMAPELFEGAAPTKRTDLYALAAVLYEAVHGRTPFTLKGNDVNGFIASVREGRRARPPSPAGFPAGLTRWLDETLAPDPADRPSSATDALARLNEACGTDFALETTDDRAARLGSGEPVGRGDELDALRREIAPSDAPRVAWLCGDAGAGKTRLLRFLAGEAIGKGWRVHAPPGALPGSADEFVDRVRADAAAAPTLVLLDELERAGNAVATFIDRIAREPRMAPVHVVAALRSGEVAHPKLRKLLADTGVVPSLARIDLAPMAEPGLKALIERATAGRSSAQARVKWLLDASEGNAGAAEALLVEGVWEKHGKVPVAVALEQSIRRRLDALSPEARAWMEALATLGDDAPDTLVGELAGLEEGAGAAANEAIAAGLARRTKTTSLSPDSRRTTDAVKAAASPERLAQLHALAATHYAAQERDTFGATAWRLARLWCGAGDVERALAAALDAASAAEVAKNWEEAAERIRFALTLLPRRDSRRAELWMRRAEALRQALMHGEAVRAFGWAARWATDPELVLEARARQAKALFMVAQSAAAARVARQVIAKAQALGSTLSEGLAWEVVADDRIQQFDFREALEPAQSAYRLLASAANADTAAALHALISVEARLHMSDTDTHFEEALRLCDAGDLRYQRMTLLLNRALVAERAGELDRMAWAIETAEQVGAGEGSAIWIRWLQQLRSRVLLLRGSYDRAAAGCRAAAELALYSNEPMVWSSAVGNTAEAMADAGRTIEARNFLLAQLSAPIPGMPAVGHAALRMTLARVSESEDRETDLNAELAILRKSTPMFCANALAFELSQATDDRFAREATTVLKDALATLHDGREPVPTIARVTLLLAIARALIAGGDYGQARDVLVGAAHPPDCPVDPFRFAQTHFLLAECGERLGFSKEAAESRSRGAALIEMAADRIEDPDWRRDFLEQPLIRNLLATIPKPSEGRRLEALYEMIRALNSESDPEALLGSILEMAMKAVAAERGMILLSGPTGTDFSVRLAKNLEKETQIDAEAVSRRIVSAAEQGESILALDAGQDDRFKDFKSVSLFRIRSLMCVPLRSRGKIVGTVYLDSRRQGKLFGHDDLRFVEAFADHAALALENARKRRELETENRRLKAVVGERSSYANIVGRSPAMQRVFDLLERIAPSDATVLIQGESGTGKELVAKALHFNGLRKHKVFLSENCAAIAETLLESELFGHVRGAFTGAERDREGVFEQAHGGTLFLDEIGDMSPAMQARLLRVLQEGELRRVGGEHPIKVDVRLIAATNKDLQAVVAAGRFREDLYYRLAVVPVQLPPLRERIGDVPLIAGHLLAQITAARGRGTPRIEADVLDALERYPWPGNVRQLENLMRRLALLAGDGSIDRSVIESDADLAKMFLGRQEAFVPVMSMEKSELEQIRRALEAAAGNRDRAARLLGISRATIYRKMREYGLR